MNLELKLGKLLADYLESQGLEITLKRTAPGGSGPATGSADRVAVEEPGEGPECREGGTTDRNRDSRAVPPGEAEAALSAAIDVLRDEARDRRTVARMIKENHGTAEEVREQMRIAGKFDDIADDLEALLPEPDSDAPFLPAAVSDVVGFESSVGREPPDRERSGRRNSVLNEPNENNL